MTRPAHTARRRGVRVAWMVGLDIALTLAVAWLVVFPTYGGRVVSHALAMSAIRVGLLGLLGLRAVMRLAPVLFWLMERTSFQSLVAARHVHSKKSGFLTAISLLSVLAVSVSSCALTTTLSVMGGFRADLKRKILANHAHVVVDRRDRQPLTHWQDTRRRVRGVPSVIGVSPYVQAEVMVSSASNLTGVVLRGVDTSMVAEVVDFPSMLDDGSLDYLHDPGRLLREQVPSEDDPDVSAGLVDSGMKLPSRSAEVLPAIMLGRELAKSLRLSVGDEVSVISPLGDLGPSGPVPKSRPFRVGAIFYSGMYEYDMKIAYVGLHAAQTFLSLPDVVTGLEVKVRATDDAPAVAADIRSELRDLGVRVQEWQVINRNLFGALELEKLAMFIALGLSMLVAGFCIVGALLLMVEEKGREVAILKAMGATDGSIVRIFVMEGAMIGAFGAVIGLAMGYVVCFVAKHFGVRMNPEVYYIDKLPVHIDPMEFAWVAVASLAVALVVTIYPAVLASRLRPVEALRYE
jgi:lipoprotein-releasing system permease protein